MRGHDRATGSGKRPGFGVLEQYGGAVAASWREMDAAMGCVKIVPRCIDAEACLLGDLPSAALESSLDEGDLASFPRV